jgi:hypothetical protein
MIEIRHMKLFSNTAFTILLSLLFLPISSCKSDTGEFDTQAFLDQHITWLADDERAGRLAGSLHEADAANYIENLFLQYGLIPAGDDDTYLQHFTLTGPMPQAMQMENYLSRNVAGMVRGTLNPDRYIIVGAHYDGQGRGGIISMDHGMEPEIHNSADDNASGTAGLLWLAKKYAENPPEKSVIFIAFSGEEMGLLGSRYYAGNLQMERDSVVAMINLDMIGRLEGRELTIFGTGTSPSWDNILDEVGQDSLSVRRSRSGTGASDHTSFYEIEIPVLHYFSGTHEQYHRAGDTADLIDLQGMEWILDHISHVIDQLAVIDASEMEFSRTQDRQQGTMPMNGISLGVVPDYSYSGDGFKVSSVRSGGVGEQSGMKDGDIIMRMGEIQISDIYGYMEALGEFESGESIIIQVRRSDELVELNVNF